MIGDVVALLTISKGLTLAYNKDLQETQEPFYDAVETARQVLAVMPGLVMGLEFDTERMRAAAQDAALGATDLAEELVRGGLPFRTAHELVGKLVQPRRGEARVAARARRRGSGGDRRAAARPRCCRRWIPRAPSPRAP